MSIEYCDGCDNLRDTDSDEGEYIPLVSTTGERFLRYRCESCLMREEENHLNHMRLVAHEGI